MASAFGVRLKREIAGAVLSGSVAVVPPPPASAGVSVVVPPPVCAGGGGAVTPVMRAIALEVSRLTKSVLFAPAATFRGPEPAGRLIGVVSVPSVASRATACVLNWAIQYAPSAP